MVRDLNDRLIGTGDVCRIRGCSPVTVNRLVKRGELPPPIKTAANTNKWWLSDVYASIEAKPRGLVPRDEVPGFGKARS